MLAHQINNNILLFGGTGTSIPTPKYQWEATEAPVYLFNPVKSTYTEISKVPNYLKWPHRWDSIKIGNDLYLMGREENSTNDKNFWQTYLWKWDGTDSTPNWSKVIPQPLPNQIDNMRLAYTSNRIYILGGEIIPTSLDEQRGEKNHTLLLKGVNSLLYVPKIAARLRKGCYFRRAHHVFHDNIIRGYFANLVWSLDRSFQKYGQDPDEQKKRHNKGKIGRVKKRGQQEPHKTQERADRQDRFTQVIP